MAQVGVASDAEHVLVNWSARAETSIALWGARNEYVSFQICVAGPCTITNVVMPTFGPFPASNIHVFTEWNLNISTPTAADGWTGPTPFIMWPVGLDDVVGESRTGGLPITVPNGQLQMFWVDILIPEGATAGTYAGTATVSISGQADQSVTCTVTVYNFSLPATSSLRTWSPSYYAALITQHLGMSDQAALNQLATRYARLFLDHRFSLSQIDTGDTSLANYNTYFAPFITGGASTRLPNARWTTFTLQGAAGGTTSNLWGGPSAFVANAVANGWLDRFFAYIADEPATTNTWGNISPNNSAWKGLDSRIKTLVTCDIAGAMANGVQNAIDILCPIIESVWPPGSSSQIGTYAAWKAGGTLPREVWTYQSLDEYQAGWLKYVADATALQMRQQAWMDYLVPVTGELFFSATYSMTFPGSPWNSIYAFNGNGGTWAFPGCAIASPNGSPAIGGTTDIPLSSFLLKQIRQGLQEYEYGRLLDAAGDNTMRTLGLQMFPGVNSQPSVATFLQNKRLIAERLNTLIGGGYPSVGPHVDSITPNVGPSAGGTTVVFAGSDFTSSDTVVFGTQAAAVIAATSTSLTVVAPANPVSTVNVTVTGPTGAYYTVTNGFTYQQTLPPPPEPSASALDPSWPVSSTLTNSSTHSMTVNAPTTVPTVLGPRLVYAVIIWNVRGGGDASGGQRPAVTITDSNGKTFTQIVAGDFTTYHPYAQGAEIHACWYTAAVPVGTVFTVTWGVGA